MDDPLLNLSPAELRKLRDDIDRLLPPNTIDALNLEGELVAQYRTIKDLMDSVKEDKDTPANQRAQVANSVVATLAQLVKLQEDLRRDEVLKLMESVLIDTLKDQPAAVRDEFFREYESRAAKAGLV